jgi:large subunit ribosomal protein L25
MAAITFELEADVRADVGKGASRRLRHASKVPAVIYGGGEKPVTLTLDHNKAMHALSHEAFYSHVLTLKVGKTIEKVILKDIQRDPSKPRIAHIDFLRVRADQKLTMNVPLHFIGEEDAPGAKEGGVFSHTMSDVEISCLPADLPEFIEVDVSGMVLDQVLHLYDLTAFAHGVEGHDHPVVSLHIPRIVEEEVVEAVTEETEVTASAEEGANEEAADAAAKGNE